MIIEQQNFLSDEECNFCIDFFEASNNKQIFQSNYLVNLEFHNDDLDIFKLIKKKLTLHMNDVDKDSFINYSEIVKYPIGNAKGEHLDHTYHPYTSIIYLNDKFTGGETVVDNQIVKPERGKVLSFNGRDLLHKVNKATADRYTISTWYKKINE